MRIDRKEGLRWFAENRSTVFDEMFSELSFVNGSGVYHKGTRYESVTNIVNALVNWPPERKGKVSPRQSKAMTRRSHMLGSSGSKEIGLIVGDEIHERIREECSNRGCNSGIGSGRLEDQLQFIHPFCTAYTQACVGNTYEKDKYAYGDFRYLLNEVFVATLPNSNANMAVCGFIDWLAKDGPYFEIYEIKTGADLEMPIDNASFNEIGSSLGLDCTRLSLSVIQMSIYAWLLNESVVAKLIEGKAAKREELGPIDGAFKARFPTEYSLVVDHYWQNYDAIDFVLEEELSFGNSLFEFKKYEGEIYAARLFPYRMYIDNTVTTFHVDQYERITIFPEKCLPFDVVEKLLRDVLDSKRNGKKR